MTSAHSCLCQQRNPRVHTSPEQGDTGLESRAPPAVNAVGKTLVVDVFPKTKLGNSELTKFSCQHIGFLDNFETHQVHQVHQD